MPLLDLLRKYRVHKAMLLHNRQALELLRDNIQRVHRATTTADILDLIFLLATTLLLSIVFLDSSYLQFFRLQSLLELVEHFELVLIEVVGRLDGACGCF